MRAKFYRSLGRARRRRPSGEGQEGRAEAFERLSGVLTVTVAYPDISEVRIEGLAPLVRPVEDAAPPRVHDPLTALLGFPAVSLRPGERCDLVFWGLRPGEEGRVTAPGLDGAAVLTRRARSTRPSSGSIARLAARARDEGEPR